MTTKYTENFGLALPDFRQGPWHDLINGDLEKIDNLIFGAMSQANVEAWANNTAYGIGINVLDAVDASVWLCVVGHTSPPTGTFLEYRTAHPTHWTRLLTGFAPRGEWAQATNYFPYDLAYDSGRGIMALCTQIHTSTLTGSIEDDQAYWAFLLDMSDAGTVIASAVSYSNTASSIPSTNVQDAVDYLEDQLVQINKVNVWQGENIGNVPQTGNPPHPVKSLQTQINDLVSSLSTLTTTVTNLSNAAMKLVGNQVTTGGFRVTPFNAANLTGSFTPDPMKGNYQYATNVGAITLVVPANDCAIDMLMINGASAGAITFSGFTVSAVVGDALTTANGHRFLISMRKINGVGTYSIKALQ